MKCFYHSADLDGKCSGAIVKMEFPHCELIGIDYGDEFPWQWIEDCEEVWMVDFCLQPHEDMERLRKVCGGNLVWIDHHKTALEWADNFGFDTKGSRRLDLAGCELTWEYIHPTDPLPLSVQLLGRYDIWKWRDIPGCLAFQMGMRLKDVRADDTELWARLFGKSYSLPSPLVDSIISDGETVLAYQKQSNSGVCSYAAHEIDWEGMRWIALNGPYRSSQVFESVYDPTKYHGMLVYGWCKTQWRFGLYSDRDDVDVSEIAKKHGGGGHKGAAGFQAKELPFPLDQIPRE